jgi:Lrp/AsnC family leucine-responsive transcriptional regulator
VLFLSLFWRKHKILTRFLAGLAKTTKKYYNLTKNGGDDMDTADRIILKTLAENARTPIKGLAEKAFLSSPAVSARVDRLEKSGIIRSYQAELDLKALGYEILAFINLSITPERRGEFQQWIESCTNVLECHHLAGTADYMLKVLVRNTLELEDFLMNKLKKIEGVVSSNTFISLSTLKEEINI